MNRNSIIKFNSVTFRYDAVDGEEDAAPVIENFNVEIEEGSFTAVLGHNGSGKSTVAKLINGLLVPDAGTVTVNGMETSDSSKTVDIRRTVGMVFQNPDNQIVSTIVEDDVAFGPENLGVPPEQIRKDVDDALKAVGMYDFRLKEPHKLSGGQKQRVAIAGVLAMKTRCIVMDEPTAMLDPRGRKEVVDTVLRLNKELGITVVYITHYMDEAVLADRVIVMDNGKTVFDDVPRKVFTNVEKLKKIGLDVPQATELAYRLRQKGLNVPPDVLNEEECAREIKKLLEEG